jgi:phosphoribosyl-AMP cyclohydrolase / phosphoribosyl-ATP pyrophosphohydrolase
MPRVRVCLKPTRACSTYNRAVSAQGREDPIEQLLAYDERGLVPCVVQDWRTGEVLTLAYMNEQALAHTRATGELHLHSRSRDELWHKGATSGNVQAVKALRVDCDGDTLLALVEPAGPACHTGERTCFHRGELLPAAPYEVLPTLERTVDERATTRPPGSYTVELLEDPERIGAKVMEEAEEVARAARAESEQRVDEEAADVLYHLLVLLHSRGRALADAERVLDDRSR